MLSNKQKTARGRNSLKWILTGVYRNLIKVRSNDYILPEESEGVRLAARALELVLEKWDGRTKEAIRITMNKER